MGSWSDVMQQVKRIQRHQNSKGDFYYSIGDVFVMLEHTCIGKCGATLRDYERAIPEWWEIEGQK